MDERGLIELCKQNDKGALEQLYVSNIRFITKCFYQMSINGKDFDDFKQLAYFAMLTALHSYNATLGYSFRTFWRYYIMHEYYQYRRLMFYPVALTRGEYEALRCTDEIGNYILKRLNDGKNPKYDHAVYNYVSRQVWTVVRTVLDETNAYVICQHYHEGRSLRSIANDLHIHPESVRKRKVRSLEKLQKCNALKSIYDAFYSEEGLFN